MYRFYFSIQLNAKKDDLIKCFENCYNSEWAQCYTNEELFEKISDVIDNNARIYLDEYFIPKKESLVKLFFDIDTKIDEVEYDFDETHELELFKNIICDEISRFSKNNYYEGSLEKINENIVVTKNSKPGVYSYHIFFNNILINKDLLIPFIQYLKEEKYDSCILMKFLDAQVYKTFRLRFIYSLKSKTKKNLVPEYYYHYPLDIDVTPDNLYLFSIYNYKQTEDTLIVLKKRYQNNIDDNIDESVDIETIETPYYIKYLSKENIKKALSVLVFNDKFISFLNDITYFEINKKYEFHIGYCKPCKREHKNNHYILCKTNYFIFGKNGNTYNCKLIWDRYFEYPKLHVSELCRYLVDEDYIRCVNPELFLVWENNSWKPIKVTSIKTNLIKNYIYNSYLITRDIDKRSLFSEKSFSNILTTLIPESNWMKETIDPYLVKFNNGYYNLKNNVFIPNGVNCKDLFKLSGIDLDYIDPNSLPRDKRQEFDENKKFVLDLFYKIIFVHENKNDIDAFKANLSSILYSGHKGVITFFYGKTNGGKSTIKMLIEETFKSTFLEIPMTAYTKFRDPNKPDAWLGSLTGKLVTFSSEKDKNEPFLAVNIKHLTGHTLTARILHSNDCVQTNISSQFVDINVLPKFDHIDTALDKRIVIIKCLTYFCNPDDKDKVFRSEGRRMFNKNPDLDKIIKSGKLSLPFIIILIEWFKEYHSDGLKMRTVKPIQCMVILKKNFSKILF